MSAQRLNRRSMRRIERDLNKDRADDAQLEVIMAWSHGGYWMPFVTAEHRHGAWDKKTGTVELYPPGRGHRCYSTCPTIGESIRQWADEMRSGER